MALSSALPPALRQTRPVQVLERLHARRRLPHAMLLHGDSMPALVELAQALAAELLKTTPAKAETHPDCFVLRPARRGRQIRIVDDKGKASPNTMRWMLQQLMQSSSAGGSKVGIVYEADRLNRSAENAFLKTLEEPPRETHLLLVTTRPYELLPTTRSRCFQFRVPLADKPIAHEGWRQWIADYQRWLDKARSVAGDAGARADVIMLTYGLISRFTALLDEIVGGSWKAERDNISEEWSDEEIEAQEVGLKRGMRVRLWQEIELATRDHVLTQSFDRAAAQSLGQAVETLEEMDFLTGVFNLNDEVALEQYFLRSLRIWAMAQ
ncbi:MAG: DNA polymerase III subunit gamma/tau [Verrucomicrobiota bacterium JB022]|nr:DNA polymerase III subunit gamma/tau [Verrucomicrobiota bacterium JB022]